MNTEDLMSDIQAIDTRSLVDKVEMNLIDFFIKKELSPGDVIPKEIELAQAMGVSRTVIRESLNRLKTMGLIESIKHKGTLIKSPNLPHILQKSMIPNILDPQSLKNVFELRLVLEVGMADLVVRRVTDKDIEELAWIVRNENSPSPDTLFDVEYEVQFHGKLYEISGNEILKEFQTMLLPVFHYVYSSGLINKPIVKKKYVSHKELVEILRERDPGQFRKGMRQHLANHFNRLF
ncbi:MAG: FadR/GntR family transcriptional regulator [Prolixibacteraceae bacterium]|jgi:DNA-binding FadR family transcriptional regulator|nr:FadR/GntR family transcriptional regulator [Bacteroidota bacterium]NLS98560.1 FadR family transcriptional regulator [Bacteroidales bacterium]OQB80261.1 MAG: HTH-type transcriptional regulator LutR [Bacteroidetes bacterium ADurb.Bin123]HNU78184.1 FadR/GntR family transcriptional regulator [Prolixibacteraceae bacterium]HNZ69577.1 FadR/GntR family transcriptional regulator [Prolixibacteraceae bacterium]